MASPILVIGAGPAGLAAAYELSKHGRPVLCLEADSIVGGIARTVEYRGFRFDIGGHRFFTKYERVENLWRQVLGDELLTRPRLSRIYYRDRFFFYPLRPLNALAGMGLIEALLIGASYLMDNIILDAHHDVWAVNADDEYLEEIDESR